MVVSGHVVMLVERAGLRIDYADSSVAKLCIIELLGKSVSHLSKNKLLAPAKERKFFRNYKFSLHSYRIQPYHEVSKIDKNNRG